MGTVRHSQQVILDAVGHADQGGPLHIVAPPGSGKTLIGLLLAMQRGHRTLALTPTTTIRHQWARTARSLAEGAWGTTTVGHTESSRDPGEQTKTSVSEDPHALGDFTALTYQILSVVDSSNPFEELARRRWVDELVEAGRTPDDAAEWLEQLEGSNRSSYSRGITRRARVIRREIVREDPSRLEEALHPNARALIARIAEAGVSTIILDECHHLLDHWALVIHALVNRIRARGVQPVLIGLTATLPSEEDGNAYENYTGLLGEVDYELPTPAVVKEGNLAPYRSFAWFVSPTDEEIAFIKNHEDRLQALVRDTFASPTGYEFLIEVLQEGEGPPSQRLAQAFKSDPVVAEAASRMLHHTTPDDPLVALFPKEAAAPAGTDQQLRLLARYALTVLLPDPAAEAQWARIKSVLVDFGYHLTDRGIRRGRDPIDTLMATTAAKDRAVVDVLRLERRNNDQVRAVVVCDFAVHGHKRGAGSEGARAGALRCHATLAAAGEIADMHPVLVTAQHLRVPTRVGAHLAGKLGEILGEELRPVPVDGSAHVSSIESSAGSARILAAVSELISTGDVGLIVGTRGLLGEGWDCPAVNTLIDLSSVATSASTQQLRGRTLRLDPQWPRKVAHNWAITCVTEPDLEIDTQGDVSRLHRKLSMVWGPSLEGTDAIVKGWEHTFSLAHMEKLGRLLGKERGASTTAVNDVCVETFPTREQSYERWGVGEEYLGAIEPTAWVRPESGRASPFRTGITLELLVLTIAALIGYGVYWGWSSILRSGDPLPGGIAALVGVAAMLFVGRKELRMLWQRAKQFALPASTYQGAALAIAATLAQRGEGPAIGANNVRVFPLGDPKAPSGYSVTIEGGTREQQAAVLDALTGLFAPITSPRFLLEVGVSELKWTKPVSSIAVRVLKLFGYKSRFFGLPRPLGRRREDAQRFADQWRRRVGPCALHEITSPEDMRLLTTARKQFGATGVKADSREVWA